MKILRGKYEKPRCDAKLKALPEKMQKQLFDYRRNHTQAETLKWLATHKIHTGTSSLYDWLKWHTLKRNLKERESTVLEFLAAYKRRHRELTRKSLSDMGEYLFNMLALEKEDVKTWSAAQQIQLKREEQALKKATLKNDNRKLDLETRRYQDEQERAKSQSGGADLTRAEKMARMKEVLSTS